ncbi:hypothetical protein WL93_03380 [Burkholderia diffusa]|nr:hypothetical protein WL93_03380 [Burkholderia diffusa]
MLGQYLSFAGVRRQTLGQSLLGTLQTFSCKPRSSCHCAMPLVFVTSVTRLEQYRPGLLQRPLAVAIQRTAGTRVSCIDQDGI